MMAECPRGDPGTTTHPVDGILPIVQLDQGVVDIVVGVVAEKA
jgi:hypothetical protein